jgi:hypothetical protein
LYLKVNYKMLEGIGGVVHNVQWGGKHPYEGDLPSSLDDYFRIITGRGADESSGAIGGEITNALGNSVAMYDFNLVINLDQSKLSLYRQFYLEDKVSTRFRSPWDGLWGGVYLSSKEKPFLKSILYEHVNTKRQDSFDYEPRGTADYYHNFVYKSGWTYRNRVLGNTLIIRDGSSNAPDNNIIVAHHVGGSGYLNDHFEWDFRYTFSRNYGQYHDQIKEWTEPCPDHTVCGEYYPLSELKKVNHSFYLGANYTLPKSPRMEFTFGLGIDVGQLYDDRLGLLFGYAYQLN